MKDTIAKVRALVSMKTSLIKALQGDLDTALFEIEKLRAENEELRKQEWWYAQNHDAAFIEREMGEYGPNATLHGTANIENSTQHCALGTESSSPELSDVVTSDDADLHIASRSDN